MNMMKSKVKSEHKRDSILSKLPKPHNWNACRGFIIHRNELPTKFVGNLFLRWGYLYELIWISESSDLKYKNMLSVLAPPEQQLTKNSTGERQETDVQKKRGQRYQWSGISAMCWENECDGGAIGETSVELSSSTNCQVSCWVLHSRLPALSAHHRALWVNCTRHEEPCPVSHL